MKITDIATTELANVLGGQAQTPARATTDTTTTNPQTGEVFRNGRLLGCAIPFEWSPSAAKCVAGGNDIPFPGN